VLKFGFSLEPEIAPVLLTLVLFVSLFFFVAVSAVLSFEDAVIVLPTASVDGECNTPPPYGFGGLVLIYYFLSIFFYWVNCVSLN